ncbi:MAG: hypothetical protein AB7S38_20710 [Vulcanimicrobiota bacterium]
MKHLLLACLTLILLIGCGGSGPPEPGSSPGATTSSETPAATPGSTPTANGSAESGSRPRQSNELSAIPAQETQLYVSPDVTDRLWQNSVSPEQRKSIEARRKARQRRGSVVSKTGGNGAPVMGVNDNVEQVP